MSRITNLHLLIEINAFLGKSIFEGGNDNIIKRGEAIKVELSRAEGVGLEEGLVVETLKEGPSLIRG